MSAVAPSMHVQLEVEQSLVVELLLQLQAESPPSKPLPNMGSP